MSVYCWMYHHTLCMISNLNEWNINNWMCLSIILSKWRHVKLWSQLPVLTATSFLQGVFRRNLAMPLQCLCKLLTTTTTAAYNFAFADSLEKFLDMYRNLCKLCVDTKQHAAVVGVARVCKDISRWLQYYAWLENSPTPMNPKFARVMRL